VRANRTPDPSDTSDVRYWGTNLVLGMACGFVDESSERRVSGESMCTAVHCGMMANRRIQGNSHITHIYVTGN